MVCPLLGFHLLLHLPHPSTGHRLLGVGLVSTMVNRRY